MSQWRTKVFPVCTGTRQWEEDVRLSTTATTTTTQAGEVIAGTCKELADWRKEFMQEMTIKSPRTMDNQEKLVDRTLVHGEEIIPLSKERITYQHQHSKSDESYTGNYNQQQYYHKQTRSDDILNHSGPPPVPTNSPAKSDWGLKRRNSNKKTSLASLGRSNSKSLENLPQATYALDNRVNDNKLHKCASQDSMQTARMNGNSVTGHSDSQDESMSSINTNNSLSGVSIMENLVREFGLQPHSLTANSSALLAGEQQVERLQTDARGPPPSYPGTGKTVSNVNQTQGGAMAANNNAGEHDGRPTTPTSGSLLSKSRSYESMQDSVTSSMGSLTSTSPSQHTDTEVVPFEIDHEAIATRATHMAEFLHEENAALRQELEMYYQKVNRLQKFEQDIHKVQSAHEMLVESTKKREQLETMVRGKLENECKKLQEQVKLYQAHLEITKDQLTQREQAKSASDSDLRLEITKRDALLTQLASQHKEALAEKQRMAVELGAQQATLNDQRSHIDVLDTALSNAQANVVKYQEELRRRQPYVEKVGLLQKYLQTLQATYQKRDHLEQKYRVKLERELAALKGHHSNQDEGVSELDGGNSSQTLVELLKEREDTILRLETEVTKCQQRYLEEFTMRQVSNEYMTQESCQQQGEAEMAAAAEAQAEKARYQEELQFVQSKFQQLEAKINGLNAELAQKNMIIEMLRRQLMEKEHIISSMERLPRPISSSSPQNSQQNIVRKSSLESMHNMAVSPGSSSSLQNLMQRSPVSSQQNLVMRSPNGSHQSLAVKAPSRGPGSQERLLTLSDSHTSLSTSGLSTAGTDGSDTDLAKERAVLDEKLMMLDQEIAQQDKILETLWK